MRAAVCCSVGAFLAISSQLRAGERPLGQPLSTLTLTGMQGDQQQYRPLSGQVTVVVFFSTRCPMSNAFNARRNLLYHDYGGQVRFLAIDPNSNESLEEVRTYAKDAAFDFPVYRDERNQAADLFAARNTTEAFVFDGAGTMRYRGYIEDSPNPERATRRPLRLAIEAVLAGRPVLTPETKGIGCAIRRTLHLSSATPP